MARRNNRDLPESLEPQAATSGILRVITSSPTNHRPRRRWRRNLLAYIPLVPYLAWLIIRHRSPTVFTAANPGIATGGTLGESKAATLTSVERAGGPVAEFTLVAPHSDRGARVRAATRWMEETGVPFPVIVKPDVGEQGWGVALSCTRRGMERYFECMQDAVIVQRYFPGIEAGIFYCRCPGEPKGHIFSITDKHFPVVAGDGRSTLRELITTHPRYRLQASLFLDRHAHRLQEIPAAGEPVRLAIAGNHAQGTMFRDGSHLLTPELEARVDDIARRTPGFFIGRFDVRYRDTAAFMAGRDFAIVELNGATAESTNIYDPDRSLLAAYRVLFRQWSLVFRIGAANRARGVGPTPTGRLVRLIWNHLTTPVADSISD